MENKFVLDLMKLSGMKYRQGYYTPQQWKEKTGVDVSLFYDYIIVNHYGYCVWSDRAESLYQDHVKAVRNNWQSLGVGVA